MHTCIGAIAVVLAVVLNVTMLRRSRAYPPNRPGSCVPFGLPGGVGGRAMTVVFPSATGRVGWNQDARTESHG